MRWRGHVRLLVLTVTSHAAGSQAAPTLPTSGAIYLEDPELPSSDCNFAYCSAAQPSAMVNFSVVEIRSDPPPDTFTFDGLDSARLKIVEESITRDDALAGACLTSQLGQRYVAGSWAMTGVETTADGDLLSSTAGLYFEMGGRYKLCYSRNGTFDVNDGDVVPVPIEVKGVYDTNCTKLNCLKEHPYYCYLRKEAYSTVSGLYSLTTSCTVDYSYEGAGFYPISSPGVGTWTAEFVAAYSDAGDVQSVAQQQCGSPPASFICRNAGACDAGSAYIEPLEAAQFRQIVFPTTSDELVGDTFYPRTVAACYCPDRNGCQANSNFVQQIGIMHFYLIKVCHIYDTRCESDYTGVVAQYQFRIRVECPTDACPANDNNRIKIIPAAAANDLPSWNPESGCGVSTHGMLGTTNVLPQRAVTGGVVNPQNCGGALDCTLGGGFRQDYKEFGGSKGFQFILGHSHHEIRRFHENKDFDVCYCNDDCHVRTNWFKAGQMRLSPTRLVSAATSKSTAPAQMSVEFLNVGGIVGLNRPYTDAGVLGLNEGAVLKILEDKEKVAVDYDCEQNGYDPTLVNGLSNQVSASLNFRAALQTQTPADPTKLVFNSNSFVNSIEVVKPGNIAICYCALTIDSVCVEETNWKLLTHMTIKGPKGQHSWRRSTNVNFRFSFDGYGLSSSDTVRIISSDASCTDNNGNPNSADFSYTSIKVKCPDPCMEVTLVDGAEPGDLPTMVLSSDTYNCNTQNAECSTNDIASLAVISETQTELVFEHPPGMLEGDEITLGANIDIQCDPSDLSCMDEKDEQIATLTGIFEFADVATKTSVAPSTYMAVHTITYVSGRVVRINVGWPSPAPNFKIVRANANLALGYAGRGGLWTHRSRAITREEIYGTEERAGLRVCWRYGSPGGGERYVEEVGRLDIVAPTIMLGATLSLTTTLYGQKAPAILTFTTARGSAGSRYEEAEGSLRLNLVIMDTSQLDMTYTDGSDIPLSIDEGDQDNAKQSTCGKLFLEVWSDDSERGFPLPKGCYFSSYASGFGYTRKLTMLFEGQSGLNKDTTYQIVINAGVMDESVEKDHTVMELFTMDDVINKPYEAIEYAEIALATAPQPEGTGDTDPKIRVPDGFKIVGGHDTLLRLKTADNLRFELMGGQTFKKIAAGHIFRIYLWPLTQWETASSCQAKCFDTSESNFVCGAFQSCTGMPTVSGMNNNILKLVMPTVMSDVYNSTKAKIEVSGLTIPAGGFFAGRLGAQVTRDDDTAPHYVVSVGDFIWKEPNVGHPVSKVMSSVGGGNELPFRGDTENVLYVRILLSSTVFARTSDTGNDASFKIILPPNYACINQQPFAAAGTNVWAAPTDLASMTEVPQGRGTPTDGTASLGWSVNGNECTYTPEHPFGVVYAGSSLMIKITVDNPKLVLQRSDPSNLWSLTMTGKGLHPTVQRETSRYPFLVGAGEEFYQTNVAVLGKVSDAFCQPIDLAPIPMVQALYLEVFFRPETQVESGGLVSVTAPSGYTFGFSCLAEDLEDMYYATGTDAGAATQRLPGIASCTSVGVKLDKANIRLMRILRPGLIYGFRLRVQSDTEVATSEDTWNIYTADADDYLIDGIQGSMSCAFGSGQYWGARQSSPMVATMTVADMRPFAMTGRCAYVSVTMSNVPDGPSGPISLFAPQGFEWDLGCPGFAYVFQTAAGAGSNAPYVPAGVTAAFPAGTPMESGNMLTWASASFSNAETYGFSVPVRVPSKTPTSSSNTFFLQLGTRAAAASPAPVVRELKNVVVDYTSTVQAKENALQFQVETVTEIPGNGGITILAGSGFIFESMCAVTPVLDPTASPPPDLLCSAAYDFALSRYRLVLQVPPGGRLPAGLHSFAIVGSNPQESVLNFPLAGSPCGTSVCWSFDTFENLNGPLERATKLDFGASAQGFSIRAQMYDAMAPDITLAERAATARDDRPLMQNNVIFGFQVIENMAGSMILLLRGPYGFTFEEECLSSMEVNQTTVFGVGSKFPPDYAVWPDGVRVVDCVGSGSDARITLDSATGPGFTTGNLYVFRIGFTNPLETPSENFWTIELAPLSAAGQSSARFDGIVLWALTNTDVSSMSTSRVLFGDPILQNPVTIRFRPHNVLEPTGYIKVEVPDDFTIVHLPSMVCEISLEEVPYEKLGVSFPGYRWATEALICVVDETDTRIATISFMDTYSLTPGLDYELVIKVFNPPVPSGIPTVWKVQTWDQDGMALDGSEMKSFTLNEAMLTLSYFNADQNGGATLPDAFSFKMQFPEDLLPGESIVFMAPPGFIMTNACSGLAWFAVQDTTPMDGYSPLPTSPLTCTVSELRIDITAPDIVLANAILQFYIPLTNPTSTPPMRANFWRCFHYDSRMTVISSKALESWTIFPQIANTQFRLLGPALAAGATTSIRLSFTPVSSAEDVLIAVDRPLGFDFNFATLESDDQEVLVKNTNQIRVKVNIRAKSAVIIVLNNVILGSPGGQTEITLTTFIGGLFQNGEWAVGELLDEISGFSEGFRLPGKLKVISESLQSEYQQQSVLYPVQSLWSVQMTKPALAKFDFYVTQVAVTGTRLVISSSPYLPTPDTFYLRKKQSTVVSSAASQPVEVIGTSGLAISSGRLQATLDNPLLPDIIYQMDVSVITPTAAEAKAAESSAAGNIYWTISTEDGRELPVNTNDADSRPFKIVEELFFNVSSSFSPPTAQVEISLSIAAGLYHPTELTLVAPLGFSFPDDCLVYGGSEVLACAPGTRVAGHATAVLSLPEAGLTYQPPDLRLWTITPTATPARKEWFLEGTYVWNGVQVCWGEAAGIEVMQMAGSSVSYPAIPTVQARIIWTFMTQVVVQSGGYLQLDLPAGFNPECGPGYFETLSFPVTTSCSVEPDGKTVFIAINTTIVPDDYVFAFFVSPPGLTPEPNDFSITLRDNLGNVRDGAIAMPGLPLMDKLQIQEAPLAWTVSKPGWKSDITMGFDVLETLPDNFVAAEQQVGQILLTFPEGFIHEVSSTSDFTILSGTLPLQAEDWLDYYSRDRLLIKLNLNQSYWRTMTRGIYQFQVPVLLPTQLPVYNVWHVSLCTLTTYPGECKSPSDPGVLVTFAIPGFIFGDESVAAAGNAKHGAKASTLSISLMLIVSFAFALCME